jgi:nitrate/TMAO reductase-like tetraheme cytochrome c subunit
MKNLLLIALVAIVFSFCYNIHLTSNTASSVKCHTNFKIVIYNLNATEHSDLLAQSPIVTDMPDHHNDERTKVG